MKLPYTEGSVFEVPLRRGGTARGIVARASPRGRILLGYFFGPRLSVSDAIVTHDLDPHRAILHGRFGDLGLINGSWKIHGRLPNGDRSEWPMPDFVIMDPLGRRKPLRVQYSNTDPSRVERRFPVDDEIGLELDSLYGFGAVEIALDKLLG